MFLVFLLYFVVSARCSTPQILRASLEAVLDHRQQPFLPNVDKIRPKCQLRLNASEFTTVNVTGVESIGLSLVNTNRQCDAVGMQFCRTFILSPTGPPTFKPHENSDWRKQHLTQKEYLGCYPFICNQEDISNFAAVSSADEFRFDGRMQSSTYTVSHCDGDSERGAGFWITVCLWGIFGTMAALGTFLDSCVKLSRKNENSVNPDILSNATDNQNNRNVKEIPSIVISCATDSLGSVHGSNRRGSFDSIRSDDGARQPSNSVCNTDASAERRITHVLVHHPRTDPSTTTPGSNSQFSHSTISPALLCGKSWSCSDVAGASESSGSAQRTLNFSDPSVFVSTLQSPMDQKKCRGDVPEDLPEPSRYLFSVNPRWKWARLLLETVYKSSTVCGAEEIFNTAQPEEDALFTFIHALKTMAIWWFLLYQTAIYLGTSDLLDNKEDFRAAIPSLGYQIVFNSFPHLQTFFFATAILDAKTFTRRLENTDSFTDVIIALLLSLAKKFFMQLPYYTLAILTWSYVTPTVGSGAIWYVVRNNNCANLWWTDFFYLSNFYPTDAVDQCMPWAWFTACDMQMYILGLFLTALLYKQFRLGLIATAVSLVATVVLDLYLANRENLLASPMVEFFVDMRNATEANAMQRGEDGNGCSFDVLLNKPYFYWVSYAIGISLGVMLRKKRWLSTAFVALFSILQTACILCLVMIILCGSWFYSNAAIQFGPIILNGVSLVWVFLLIPIVISWRYTCKGPIYLLLSASWWVTIAKLNFAVFIVNPLVLSLIFFNADYILHFGSSSLVVYFVSTLAMTYLVVVASKIFGHYPFLHLLTMAYTLVLPRKCREMIHSTYEAKCVYEIKKASCRRNSRIKYGRRSSRSRWGPRRSSLRRGPRRSFLLSARFRARSFETLFTPLLQTNSPL